MECAFLMVSAAIAGNALAQAKGPSEQTQAKTVCKYDNRTRELRCTTPEPKGTAEPPMEAVSPQVQPGRVYYRDCAAAWRAGVAPIYRGQPGYRIELDGDYDGIACEPFRGRRRR